MMSLCDLLKTIGLNHQYLGDNSKEDVEKQFREYIRRRHPIPEDHMKIFISLKQEWMDRFAPDHGRKEFEDPKEAGKRFYASQRYAAQTISSMLDQDARNEQERPGSARAAKQDG